jgi:hypothetical protein
VTLAFFFVLVRSSFADRSTLARRIETEFDSLDSSDSVVSFCTDRRRQGQQEPSVAMLSFIQRNMSS